MIELEIPGFGPLRLAHLVCDYNGTLARDGVLIRGVAGDLAALAGKLEIHVLTADTFGSAARELERAPVRLVVVSAARQDAAKFGYVDRLGRNSVAAIGNGRNDRRMLAAARVGVAVLGEEGCAAEAAAAADIVVPGARAALGLFRYPLRLVATLRS